MNIVLVAHTLKASWGPLGPVDYTMKTAALHCFKIARDLFLLLITNLAMEINEKLHVFI